MSLVSTAVNAFRTSVPHHLRGRWRDKVPVLRNPIVDIAFSTSSEVRKCALSQICNVSARTCWRGDQEIVGRGLGVARLKWRWRDRTWDGRVRGDHGNGVQIIKGGLGMGTGDMFHAMVVQPVRRTCLDSAVDGEV